ncbi:hypothetical protein H8E07_05590 [bacterium]|nr:hypothetical protein [bacterium]
MTVPKRRDFDAQDRFGTARSRRSARPAPAAPIRSLFFAKQGSEAACIQSAGADAVVLDLEDSVKPADRPAARLWISGLLRDGLDPGREQGQRVFVRVNAIDASAEVEADLQAVVRDGLEGLVLPMLNSAADVVAFDHRVSAAERAAGLPAGSVRFFCLLETPAAILAAAEIAAASPRTIALSFGHADFLRGTQGASTADSLLTARSTVVMAARAQGLQVIASPFIDLHNDRAFARECSDMKALGFSGIYTLHPRQNPVAAKAFAPTPQDLRRARQIVEQVGRGGVATIDGEMVGPPMLAWAETVLAQAGGGATAQNSTETDTPAPATISASVPRYGIDLTRLRPGQVLESPYALTIDDGWRATWQSAFHASNQIETSAEFARSLGLADRMLPYSLLLNLTLCMSVEPFSESCRFHLGLLDAIAERPAHVGDTFRNRILVESVRNTARGDASVIRTRHILINQRGERVFSLTKMSYFDPVAPACVGAIDPDGIGGDFSPSAAPAQSLRDRMIHAVGAGLPGSSTAATAPDLAAGQLILHPPVRPIGWSENLGLTTLLRNTHPLHFDAQRYGREDIVVCGGFVQALTHAAGERELRQIVHEQVVHSSHINTVAPEDRIGAISFVCALTPLNDALEEVELKTFGLRNVDIAQELDNRPLPLALFEAEGTKPSVYEDICQRDCPDLSGRIALQIERKILRLRG